MQLLIIKIPVSPAASDSRGESSQLSRPSVIRSVLNPHVPLSEGELPRVVGPALSNYEDSDMLDVLGHCFTDPLFQSLLRFPDGTELAPSQFDELLTSTQMEPVEEVELAQGRPVGSVLKLLSESMLERERETGLSSVMGPEMCLTTEEKNRLTDLFNGQVSACRDCMPVRLVGPSRTRTGLLSWRTTFLFT